MEGPENGRLLFINTGRVLGRNVTTQQAHLLRLRGCYYLDLERSGKYVTLIKLE